MKSYDNIFELSKKISKALSKGEKPVDLQKFKLFSDKTKERIFKELSKETIDAEIAKLKKVDVEKGWENMLPKLKPQKKLSISSFYKVAAVVFLFISIAYVTFYNTRQTEHLKSVGSQIIAGTDKAILTLEDGSKVALQKDVPFENELVKSNGEQLEYQNVQNHSYTAFNYLAVPRGGKYQLVLSDGTKVWLNADTKLKYPAVFKKGETRKVELMYGEAYFDVSPSTKHQGVGFNVICKGQEVEVVGTEFNIKAYSDEHHIYTTLVEGKVGLTLENGEKEFLNPSEQTVLNLQTKYLTKSKVDVDYDVAWVRGYFNFKDKPLNDIMKVLSRWYDVEIFFESPELEKVKFSGLLNRKQNIGDILKGIQNTKFINAYGIKNKTITIK
tara:strand:- start:15880 stop:17034 length:1155 start_codon:yes stop_codon:yes gene_type:complete